MESPDADTTTLPKSFTTKLQMHESIRLDWKDINYNMMVKNPKSTPINTIYDDKQILRSQSGFARSGEMLAIMGPTGCGKTSLLNILAARAPLGSKKFAKLSGEVYVNGRSRKDETFRSLSAYVLQDDKLYPHLTVFETLLVAAHFYLPNSFTLAEKEELVESVIGELGLRKARNTIIGDEKVRGVSGGERRRANIAVQLITNPSVLFLDEPTSGLDAFQAQSVMEAMKSMSDNNRLVISVIHQPRSSIYNMFDRLLLLSEGRVMYFGNADAAVDYFNAVGYLCPDNFSPSDYYLDVLSPDNRTPELDLAAKERIDQLDLHWRTTSKIESNKNEVIPSEGDVPPASGQGGRVFENLKILCWRSFVEQCRDLSTLKLKFFISIFFGLLIGGIYSGTRLNQHGIQNRTGLLFLIVINQTFNPMFAVLNVFPKEKVIVFRERSAKAYQGISYFLAKYFVEIPINMAPTLLLGTITFWLAGLNPKTFGYYLLILGYHNICAITAGLAIGAISPTVESATALGTPIIIIMVLFGGFYINVDALPIVANWLPYLSFLKWTFEALCINEFVGLKFSCGDATKETCVTTGEQVLENLGFGGHTPQPALFGLAMVQIGFFVLAFLLLEFSKMKYMPLGYKGKKYKETSIPTKVVPSSPDEVSVINQ